MRPFGSGNPLDNIPTPPDTVATFVMTGGSSVQASDWFSSGSTALSKAGDAGGPQIVRFTGRTSIASSGFNFMVNLFSTLAQVAPASGTTVGMLPSSGVTFPVNGSGIYQIPAGSTGYSVASVSSGLIYAEQWRK